MILGCYLPLLLRESSPHKFQVVGDSYIHGLSDSIALLGPLPHPWSIKNDYDSAGFWLPIYHNSATGETTLEDPRLGPLPRDWRRVEGERSRSDPEVFAQFENVGTGRKVNSDPRLFPAALGESGVDLELLSLI